jgi:hypothetical protein
MTFMDHEHLFYKLPVQFMIWRQIISWLNSVVSQGPWPINRSASAFFMCELLLTNSNGNLNHFIDGCEQTVRGTVDERLTVMYTLLENTKLAQTQKP